MSICSAGRRARVAGVRTLYVFNTLDRRDDGSYPQADYDLSEKVVTYWTNFCKYANPCGAVASDDWKPYSVGSPFTKVLDIE